MENGEWKIKEQHRNEDNNNNKKLFHYKLVMLRLWIIDAIERIIPTATAETIEKDENLWNY